MGVKVRAVRGVWREVVDHKGKRVSRNVGRGREGKRAAHVAAEKIAAKLALGDLSPLEPATSLAAAPTVPRFADLAAEWLERYPVVRGLRRGTVDNYRSFVEHHLLPAFGEMPVTAITTDAVEGFIAAKLGTAGSTRFPGKPISRGALRVGLVPLRSILRRAVRRGLIPANPVADLDERFPRVDDERVDPFTTAELGAILDAAQRINPGFAALIRLTAGVRYREPEQLRHSWASTLLSRNAPLLYVQKQGGWRSVTVLLRVYARWIPQDGEATPARPAATPAQPPALSAGLA